MNKLAAERDAVIQLLHAAVGGPGGKNIPMQVAKLLQEADEDHLAGATVLKFNNVPIVSREVRKTK